MTIDARTFFAARLQFQTDVSDVHAALGSELLIDARSAEAFAQGHIPGARNVPHAEIATAEFEPGTSVVTYCWGPACNGATRAALALAGRGIPVREMIGGLEYWVREGFPMRTPEGVITQAADPLTAPASVSVACGC